MTQKILGLKLTLEDPETGSLSEWHILDSYHVYKYANQTHAVFATYVSQQKYAEGKQPVGRSISIQIDSLPQPGDDIEQWLYRHACAHAPDNPEPSPLAGAEEVYGGSES